MLPEKSRDSFSSPPIASPHGDEAPHKQPPPDDLGPHVRVRSTVKSALLFTCIELCQPAGILLSLFLLIFCRVLIVDDIFKAALLTFGFLLICLIVEYLGALSYTVELLPEGIYRCKTFRKTLFPWGRLLWIQDFGGSIYVATFGPGCFIPRESFASREQAREFARIVRELRRTKGEAWPTIFGEVSSLEGERNLGKSE